MRIKVEIDEALIQEAMRYSEARSKRALVEEALDGDGKDDGEAGEDHPRK